MFLAIYSKVSLKKTFPVPFFLFLRVLKYLFNKSASHFLFHISLILLCIFLGGCSGTGAGADSKQRIACTKPNDSSYWTGGTGLDSADDCEWACDGGFDNSQNQNLCETTEAGYYSPAGSNARTECTGKSDDSSWTSGTGLDSADDCEWACDGGFDNSQNQNLCETTEAGYYSPAGNSARTSCTKPDDSSWTSGTGLDSADDCWACDGGFDNSQNQNLCETTEAGYYSPAGSNARTECTGKSDDSSWTSGTGLDSADDCEWACDGGFDNSQNQNLCETTEAGYYSPAGNSARTSCTKPDDSSWTSGTGLDSADDCWACDGGFDNSQNQNLCETTEAGYYSPAGNSARTSCTKPDDSSWTSGTGLDSADDCWACDGGFDNSQNQNLCETTEAGYYSPAGSNARISCSDTTKPDDSSWTSGTGLAKADECWTCDNAGYYSSRNRSACVKVNIAIAAGDSHTCAILNDDGDTSNGGSVKCWGSNSSGQTGGRTSYSSITASGTAGNPLSGQTATHIAAGDSHTCAILNDDGDTSNGGSVKCWGSNSSGQTGGRTSSSSRTISGTAGNPLSGQTATHIAAGDSHTCAILNDDGDTSNGGPVKCWGSNSSGQTGGRTSSSSRTISGTAGNPLSGQTATHIAAGDSHTCAILNDDGDTSNGGPVKCWGSNSSGQTGGRTSSSSRTISGTAGNPLSGQIATHIAAGDSHTCAILNDDGDTSNGGPVKCWGSNSSGQTGGRTSSSSRTISGTAGNPLSGQIATHIAAGSSHTCAILSDKSVKCWGSNSSGQTGGRTSSSSRTISGTAGNPLSGQIATHIAAGSSHTCAILKDGGLKCWGSYIETNIYISLTNIAAGDSHTCAILDDDGDTANGGPVKCWGSNSSGQTGGGTSSSFRTISGTLGNPLSGQTATHIAAGSSHTCAILSDKSVKCWGRSSDGQTGGGTSSSFSFRTISGTLGNPLSGQTATHIAAGSSHTCAILSDKSVKCWGSNSSGQTGGRTSSSSRTISGTAGNPLSGQTATHIAAGDSHTCAILSDKSVKCWGSNSSGQTGGRTSSSSRTISGTAGNPLSGQTATHIAAGSSHTCAILSDKSVKCWGRSSDGQTGGGTSSSFSFRTISGTLGNPLSGQTATHIAAGSSHTCAILSDKSVKCWGRSSDGQTGGGTPLSQREEATHIAAGLKHTCAILTDKSVKCWENKIMCLIT